MLALLSPQVFHLSILWASVYPSPGLLRNKNLIPGRPIENLPSAIVAIATIKLL